MEYKELEKAFDAFVEDDYETAKEKIGAEFDKQKGQFLKDKLGLQNDPLNVQEPEEE